MKIELRQSGEARVPIEHNRELRATAVRYALEVVGRPRFADDASLEFVLDTQRRVGEAVIDVARVFEDYIDAG